MRSQTQMLSFLDENLLYHEVKTKGNKIICRRTVNSRSFSSFKLTFLKTGEVSLNVRSYTERFTSESDMFNFMGAFAFLNNWHGRLGEHEAEGEGLFSTAQAK